MSRAKESGGVLVPILEELLEEEVIPQDEEDYRFINMLIRARGIPRKEGVFSPSMLGSCIRQAYFSKRKVEKHTPRNPQTNGYFLKGNFVHFQWQFAMWKAHRKGLLELVTIEAEDESVDFYGNGTRPAVELRVMASDATDFGGTIDVLAKIRKVHVIDFKGVNLIEFQRAIKRGAKQQYRKQIVGYAGIARQNYPDMKFGDCLLVSESKAGPIAGRGSPIALHETRVPIDEFTGEVKRRLRTLRWYDSRNEVPPIECVSTAHMGFQECAFKRFCDEEVKLVQREREDRAKKQPRDWKVSRNSG